VKAGPSVTVSIRDRRLRSTLDTGRRHDDPATWLNGDEAAAFFRITRWAVDAMAWRERLGVSDGEATRWTTGRSTPRARAQT
jgi:hypothetical protein